MPSRAPAPPRQENILYLNGERGGLVNNCCFPSTIAPSYAPPGRVSLPYKELHLGRALHCLRFLPHTCMQCMPDGNKMMPLHIVCVKHFYSVCISTWGRLHKQSSHNVG